MEHFQTPLAPFVSSATIGAPNYTSNIRILGQEDEGELCRIFLTLEPSARYCRFGASVTDACLIDHAKRSLANADWIVGAFVGEHIRGLVGGYSGQSSDEVEAAFVVPAIGWSGRPDKEHALAATTGQNAIAVLGIGSNRLPRTSRRAWAAARASYGPAFPQLKYGNAYAL